MQRIRIYPGELKFVLVKISPDSGRLHGKHAKENQTLLTFLTTDNLSGLPCSHECKYGRERIHLVFIFVHAVML